MEKNIVWHSSLVTHAARRKILSQKPMVLWFTGLSGSGKSTIAADVERRLNDNGYAVYMLDGDTVRHGLNGNLGFSDDDRAENIRRIYETARLMADSGLIVLVSAITPMKKMRADARACIENICGFAEIYVDTDIKTCASRDPKGLYKRAYAGEITDFTGVSAPYEVPESPDIILDTAAYSVEQNSEKVYNYIIENQINYKELLDVILPTAVKAGEVIMDIYNTDDFSVEFKSDSSPLTKADKAANTVICDNLSAHFPYYAILAEESADDLSRLRERYCFIVDPLDGTKEFIKRNGEFTVNIALAFDGNIVLGVIYIPCTKTLYYAYKDGGAYKSVDGGVHTRINASGRTTDLVAMTSRSHGDGAKLDELFEKNPGKIGSLIASGSSIKGCLVAEGMADIYYRFGYTMEWDTAAMQCICEEAGAVFMQLDDTPMMYNRRNTLNEKGFYILNKAENKLH